MSRSYWHGTALGGGALAAYRPVRATENRTDHTVLDHLQRGPGVTPEGIAADLGLHPAAVRLSLHRLAAAHQLPCLPLPARDADPRRGGPPPTSVAALLADRPTYAVRHR
ncbi:MULTISPECIES: helix-turn-helix domain-containing protein [Kitasatospora]|uniref:Uncharacterized protein n=1 Tax=Kitasatospora cathayae TaxID=3004092 RepID=A0ABY7PWY0_9ACTN|nr:hypothetical protein [Kitasatospora sp. HUAS 3-15]WBP84918.1 hypothetical protein O1G21_03000 [Kitasatospora sp. HUAS 3-15]